MAGKALYTGSFDPVTMGHVNIIRRAAGMFDSVTVGVIDNPSKNAMFSMEDRKRMIEDALKDLDNVNVDRFTGLLADYVNENGYDAVVRGLRSGADFEYEYQMAQMNARLFNEGVETVFLMADPRFSFVSSSMIKEVNGLGGSIEGLVPEEVLTRMVK